MRTEKDYIGTMEIPDNALYGIHSLRAKNNFPDTSAFPVEWYKAMGKVKLSIYLVYKDFSDAVKKNYPDTSLKLIDNKIVQAMIETAQEVSEGKYYEHFIVPAIQGGAGTSINMNINEIIANASLLKLGYKPGRYDIIDPVEHANVYQSTNDTVPTALKVAIMELLLELEEKINITRGHTERLEKTYRNALRIGYTQLQEAVPTSFGKQFGAYSEALGRDWWRVSKAFERIKTVNLGGSAIGTSVSVPRYIVVEVVPHLRRITDLPLTQSENLVENTQNLDSLVEVHAIIKAHAVNLEKIVSDLRLQASELVGRNEVVLPQKQVGSSIMPSKINPVIPEFVISVAHKVYANDMLIGNMAAQGNFELNAYIPVIGVAMLESLKLLIAANKTISKNMLAGLKIDTTTAYGQLLKSPSITTALNHIIGYHKAALLAKEMRKSKCDIFEANRKLQLLEQEQLEQLLEPSKLLQKGFSVKDIK